MVCYGRSVEEAAVFFYRGCFGSVVFVVFVCFDSRSGADCCVGYVVVEVFDDPCGSHASHVWLCDAIDGSDDAESFGDGLVFVVLIVGRGCIGCRGGVVCGL